MPHAEKPAEHDIASVWNGDGVSLSAEQDYLWGVDLYNYGFYWEAHEVWEGLWKRAEVGTSPRFYLQGLIQAAAAMLKALALQWQPCQTLAQKALAKFTKAIELSGSHSGRLDVARYRDELLQYCRAMDSSASKPRLLLKTGR